MILQIFIGLLAMTTISLFVTQGRRKRIWSVLLLCGLAVISYFFVTNLNTDSQTAFIYQWLPYDMIRADFYGKDAMQSVYYAQKVFAE